MSCWMRSSWRYLRTAYEIHTRATDFRSEHSGDVAKAMGDNEATVCRYYIKKLEPDTGQAWFDIRPGMNKKDRAHGVQPRKFIAVFGDSTSRCPSMPPCLQLFSS